MLLGAEIFFDILQNEQLRLGKDLPIIQNTEFGWIISGKTINESDGVARSCYLSVEALDNQLCKFWQIEEGERDKILSPEDQACEAHFKTNTIRDETGRFVVKLPFKQDNTLGESYNNAVKRFKQLEKKFTLDETLKQHYVEFLDEYRRLGHMKEVIADNTQIGYYLPHHAVLKDTSLTTKIRVVFDASAPTSNGVSLNNTLLAGPTIQEDLYSILSRFRTHTYVMTADIEKMYRQVRVHAEDTIYQKILWRSDPDEEIKTYMLQTVTYGTTSAPFLAVRALQQLAEDESSNFPLAATILKRDFYVDDLLTGGSDFQQTAQLKRELITLLNQGGFKLRKWLSNEPRLLIDNQEDRAEDLLLHLDISQTIKTLGL